MRKIIPFLVLALATLFSSTTLAAGDRVWIDNQTGLTLQVYEVEAYGHKPYDHGGYYQQERPKPFQQIPAGKNYHFALVHWLGNRITELNVSFGAHDCKTNSWPNLCKLRVGYTFHFYHEKAICTGGIFNTTVSNDGADNDGIVNWTYTIKSGP